MLDAGPGAGLLAPDKDDLAEEVRNLFVHFIEK